MLSLLNNSVTFEYFVCILSDRNGKTIVKLSNFSKSMTENLKTKFTKLIYFEKFYDVRKALRRKRYLDKMDDLKRLTLARNKNPELLNLIFTIYDS